MEFLPTKKSHFFFGFLTVDSTPSNPPASSAEKSYHFASAFATNF